MPDDGDARWLAAGSIERVHERAALVQRLFELARGIGVEDNATADGEHSLAAGEGRGADRNREVHGAVEPDVANAARVDVPAHGLELVDDFHGPNLRAARDRSARE